METNLERFIWLFGGFILSIILQNFVNDPLRDWRANRTKKSKQSRINELKLELSRAENLNSKREIASLEITANMYKTINLFFGLLRGIAGLTVFWFLAELVPISRGQPALDLYYVVFGLALSSLIFFSITLIKAMANGDASDAYKLAHYETYKTSVEAHISELENRTTQ